MRTVVIGDQEGFILWPGDSDEKGDVALSVLVGEGGTRIRTKGDAGPFTPNELEQIADRLRRIAWEVPVQVELPETIPDTVSEEVVWTGNMVKELRQGNMTQKVLAKRLGVSVSTLRQIERGDALIGLNEVVVLDGLKAEVEE